MWHHIRILLALVSTASLASCDYSLMFYKNVPEIDIELTVTREALDSIRETVRQVSDGQHMQFWERAALDRPGYRFRAQDKKLMILGFPSPYHHDIYWLGFYPGKMIWGQISPADMRKNVNAYGCALAKLPDVKVKIVKEFTGKDEGRKREYNEISLDCPD